MKTLEMMIQTLCQAGRCPEETIRSSVKETGKPAVGCFPLFVPEELVYAAGFLPVGLWGGISSFQKSNQYIQSFACSIMRANLELGLSGKYDMLKAALLDEFDYLSQALEQVQTADCRPMPLEEAFAVYEEYRAVMMEFINTVPDYLTTISPKVRHLILKAAWFMDKKYYTAQMRELLDALKARPKEDFTGKKFLVTGIMLDAEPVLELLEELGVAVVDDLLCHESMQFRTPTRAGGTVESKLAYRFLDLKGASPLYEPRKPRGDLLAQLARERGADGVLFCLMKFCDPEAFDHPLVKKDLAAQGIPLLSIEHDQLVESTEQLRTRIQGFLEINLS